MIANYLITAWNAIRKNALVSSINVLGLATGLAVFLLLSVHVRGELSYDRHWQGADRLYRVLQQREEGADVEQNTSTTPLLLPALKQHFPEAIEAGSRVGGLGGLEFDIAGRRVAGGLFFVDPDFIEMFGLIEVAGDLESVFRDPGSIALTEVSAGNFFGDEDPIGRTVTYLPYVGEPREYRVAAVYRPPQGRTTMDFRNLALFQDNLYPQSRWDITAVRTYVRLGGAADLEALRSRMPDFIDQHASVPPFILEPGRALQEVVGFELQPLADIYFNPIGYLENPGNKNLSMAFLAISVMVLLIASLNFVILATAQAGLRAREVAMRTVLGAGRRQIMRQFLAETFLMAAVALFLALVLLEAFIPYFDHLMDTALEIPWSAPSTWLSLAILLVAVTLLAGFYPAHVMSGFKPARTLKANKSSETGGSIRLRKILVGFQFSVSIALIVATAIIQGQLMHLGGIDPGYDKEGLLTVDLLDRMEVKPHQNTLRQEILRLPGVESAAFSGLKANDGGGFDMTGDFYSPYSREPTEVSGLIVGYGFFETYGIELLSGRVFDEASDIPERFAFRLNEEEALAQASRGLKAVINESAARRLGFSSPEDAVGRFLQEDMPMPGGVSRRVNRQIIGVVADTQYRSLREAPAPEIYQLTTDEAVFLSIRYQGDPQLMLESVRRLWQDIVGDVPFMGGFVEESVGRTFARERNEGQVLMAFSLFSILVACLGLYGMASFTIDRHVKEIGLRKAMGARVRNILGLLLWQFSGPVLIASLIACPLALWAMQRWLQRFPYRMDDWFLLPICLGAVLAALAIAWLTVTGNAARVARANPIHALRHE